MNDALNHYGYVGGNPITYSDPTGLWKTREERQAAREARRAKRRMRQYTRARKRDERNTNFKKGRGLYSNDQLDRQKARKKRKYEKHYDWAHTHGTKDTQAKAKELYKEHSTSPSSNSSSGGGSGSDGESPWFQVGRIIGFDLISELMGYGNTIKNYDALDLQLDAWRDGCFARAYIIGEFLKGKGMDVGYQLSFYGENPNNWGYHVAPFAIIDDTKYIVDPIFNDPNNSSGVYTLGKWKDIQKYVIKTQEVNIPPILRDKNIPGTFSSSHGFSFDYNNRMDFCRKYLNNLYDKYFGE